MSEVEADGMTIDAMPTKELFIEMLTRDVALVPAIVDLADNCTDGARRVRPDGSWKGFEITVELSRDGHFKIEDNCGGISVEAARLYAFRFGRPPGTESAKGEVGRFGVGMKRGLFKLGRHFVIQSTTATSRFAVTIDVELWAKLNSWQFEFDEEPTVDRTFPKNERGTSITVTKLHPGVREHFGEAPFLEQLRHELTVKLENSIRRGMVVRVNHVSLKAHVRQLVADTLLRPARRKLKLPGRHKGKVSVDIWCGLGKSESLNEARREAGWYVFCNGRMLLEADKTSATGWGETDSGAIPGFHPQFNDFRGFVYLEADDAADLPWNTTKTALDTDHPIYRKVRQEMTAMARPVIDFFNRVKKERDSRAVVGDERPGPLQLLFEKAKTKPIESVPTRQTFVVPKIAKSSPKTPAATKQKIAFDADIKQAEAVRDSIGAKSWREVGEKTFDYYFAAECGDE